MRRPCRYNWHWKYPFTSSTKCTAPVDPFFTLIVPVPSVARGTIALFARVTPAVKLTLLASGGPAASPGKRMRWPTVTARPRSGSPRPRGPWRGIPQAPPVTGKLRVALGAQDRAAGGAVRVASVDQPTRASRCRSRSAAGEGPGRRSIPPVLVTSRGGARFPSTPDDHPRARPDRGVKEAGDRVPRSGSWASRRSPRGRRRRRCSWWRGMAPAPPQTTIREPVQTAVWYWRPLGAPVVVVADHVPATGS